jgi:integrase
LREIPRATVKKCAKRSAFTLNAIPSSSCGPRHTRFVACESRRADRFISKRLGHSDISITYDRYITVYRDRDANVAKALGKIVT